MKKANTFSLNHDRFIVSKAIVFVLGIFSHLQVVNALGLPFRKPMKGNSNKNVLTRLYEASFLRTCPCTYYVTIRVQMNSNFESRVKKCCN